MKTMKRTWLAAAVGLLACLSGRWAGATGPFGADKDSLTVTITPSASYAVKITTWVAGADLGAVALGQSTQTVTPSTVTIYSSYATTGLKLQGQIVSAVTPWQFSANTAVPAQDRLAAWAVFTDTSVTSVASVGVPGGSYFQGTLPNTANSTVVDAAAPRQVGTGAGNTQFIAAPGAAGYKTMAALPSYYADQAASKAHLWLYFTLPPVTSDAALNAQHVTFTLTASAPN